MIEVTFTEVLGEINNKTKSSVNFEDILKQLGYENTLGTRKFLDFSTELSKYAVTKYTFNSKALYAFLKRFKELLKANSKGHKSILVRDIDDILVIVKSMIKDYACESDGSFEILDPDLDTLINKLGHKINMSVKVDFEVFGGIPHMLSSVKGFIKANHPESIYKFNTGDSVKLYKEFNDKLKSLSSDMYKHLMVYDLNRRIDIINNLIELELPYVFQHDPAILENLRRQRDIFQSKIDSFDYDYTKMDKIKSITVK